jgi:hypothetical protein
LLITLISISKAQIADSLFEIHSERTSVNDPWEIKTVNLDQRDSLDRLLVYETWLINNNQFVKNSFSEYYYNSFGLDSIASYLQDTSLNSYVSYVYDSVGKLVRKVKWEDRFNNGNLDSFGVSTYYYTNQGVLEYILAFYDLGFGACLDSTAFDSLGKRKFKLSGCSNDLTGGGSTTSIFYNYDSNDSLVYDSTYYSYMDLNTSYSGSGHNDYLYDSLSRRIQQRSYGFSASGYDSIISDYYYSDDLDSILFTFDQITFPTEKIEYQNSFDFTITSLIEIEQNEIKIYPNPTDRLVHIETSERIESITISSLTGKLVHSQSDIQISTVDVMVKSKLF